MKKLYARDFLLANTSPKIKPSEINDAKKNVLSLINYAARTGLLTINGEGEVGIIDFFRWAITKTKTKSNGLYWPLLENCIVLPPSPIAPITGGGCLIKVEQTIVPVDIKECQEDLVKAQREIARLQNEANALIEENNGLRVKRTRRVDKATEAANIRWKEKSQT